MLNKEYLESISKDRADFITIDKLDAYIEKTKQDVAFLKPIWDSFVRSRNPMELKYFVLGKHDSRVQQWKQLLVEADAKSKAVAEAEYNTKQSLLKKERKQLLLSRLKTLLGNIDWKQLSLGNECFKTSFNDDEYGNLEKVFYCPQELEIEIQDVRYQLEKIDADLYSSKLAMVGALKEVENFNEIAQNDFADMLHLTEDELNIYEVDYWKHRFAKQISVDYITKGVIGEGNLSSLMCLPKTTQEEIYALAGHKIDQHKEIQWVGDKIHKLEVSTSIPLISQTIAPQSGVFYPLKFAKDAPDWYPVTRIVQMDKVEIMIGSLHRTKEDTCLSEQFYIPTGKNYCKNWTICEHEDWIGDHRNRIVADALSLDCTHLLFIDDDLIIPEDALLKLFAWDLDIVGGWYLKKIPHPESASMIRSGSTKIGVPLTSTGLIEIDWSLTNGCTLFNMNVFKKLPEPWFNTTRRGTEDTYFTNAAIDAGFRVFLDTSIKCIHVNKETGQQYDINEGIKILEEIQKQKNEALAKRHNGSLKQIK